jgi:hypothetical protein
MADPKRLDPEELELDPMEVEELDRASGGGPEINNNCSCFCTTNYPDTTLAAPPAG